MNFHKIVEHDIANGPGIRVSLFVSGCDHRCPGCFNPETWDPASGKQFTEDDLLKLKTIMKSDTCSGLSLLGGDPMMPYNQKGVWEVINHIKDIPDKTIWLWTGAFYEELKKPRYVTDYTDKILDNVDVIVDGPFVEAYKDFRLKYRGSSNQRIIDVRKTRRFNCIVPYQET